MTTYVRHQAVRWINTKEEHAARILDNMSNYMLAQRVKPPAEATGPKQDQYVKLLLVCLLGVHFCNGDVPCWRPARCSYMWGIPSFYVHALLEAVLSCMLVLHAVLPVAHGVVAFLRLCTR